MQATHSQKQLTDLPEHFGVRVPSRFGDLILTHDGSWMKAPADFPALKHIAHAHEKCAASPFPDQLAHGLAQ